MFGKILPLFAVLSELANKYKYAQLVATVDYLLRSGKNTCNQERKSSDLCFSVSLHTTTESKFSQRYTTRSGKLWSVLTLGERGQLAGEANINCAGKTNT